MGKTISKRDLLIESFSKVQCEEIDDNTVLIFIKDDRLINNPLILTFYQLSIGGIIPISPLKAKFFHDSCDVIHWFYKRTNEIIYANEIIVDFTEHKIKFPTSKIIEADFFKGVIFEIEKDRDRGKLISLVEKAYRKFEKGQSFRF
ncbi:hypothetical protein ABD87_22825 [Lysinibacillus sphaericus]|uniref:hypothetical protein n=1 Tax=Lysinibacillus sphaericus TaxID=1421 RepID=UPI0018CDE2DD|nr:hypothetical protein [Lysinibacillus sphaericus]MBG9732262.1 hypothetical protein [Lysinibacillus sphaericus]